MIFDGWSVLGVFFPLIFMFVFIVFEGRHASRLDFNVTELNQTKAQKEKGEKNEG